MADVQYRGRATGALYSFDIAIIPVSLLDQFGNVIAGFYNGELCIPANRDGSVLNPQAMGIPTDELGNPLPNDGGVGNQPLYNAYVNMPDWWSNTAQEPD